MTEVNLHSLSCWDGMGTELSFVERKINVLIELKEDRKKNLSDPSLTAYWSRLQTAYIDNNQPLFISTWGINF